MRNCASGWLHKGSINFCYTLEISYLRIRLQNATKTCTDYPVAYFDKLLDKHIKLGNHVRQEMKSIIIGPHYFQLKT